MVCGLLPMFVEFAADLRCEFECFRGCWKSGVVKVNEEAWLRSRVRCVEKDEVGKCRKIESVFERLPSHRPPNPKQTKQVDRRKMSE
jgi:hypothetical protein